MNHRTIEHETDELARRKGIANTYDWNRLTFMQ